ncbi:MAG: hypothetical protein Q8L34_00425 [Candidatus Woesearchaeota archaeon]|nr:hypothetical protein [Candidatus Woesearchaeota archaeon]
MRLLHPIRSLVDFCRELEKDLADARTLGRERAGYDAIAFMMNSFPVGLPSNDPATHQQFVQNVVTLATEGRTRLHALTSEYGLLLRLAFQRGYKEMMRLQ